MIHHGDCLDVMAGMEPESVDAVVTDPPYNLVSIGQRFGADNAAPVKDDNFGGRYGRLARGFMGKTWDGDGIAFRPETWAACLRVAKPSAYLLAFGGTRTVHRMTVAIEDAGWVIRDMLVWAYASGFPKSKASLKPAWEPIVMARKPGPLRELAIDACRIPVEGGLTTGGRSVGRQFAEGSGGFTDRDRADEHPLGRWPANVILTDPIFDGGWDGVVGGGTSESGSRTGEYGGSDSWSGQYGPVSRAVDGDSGTYSRFFVLPKADRADREPVLGGLPERAAFTHNSDGRDMTNVHNGLGGGERARIERGEPAYRPRANVHPTVKPVDLMRHLVRLVTPTPGGVVLDPFAGSGSTLLAAEMEGFEWIGIEKEAEYVAIAEARLNGTQRGLGLDSPAPTPKRVTGGSLEEKRAKGYRHAVNDPAARSQVGALMSGLRGEGRAEEIAESNPKESRPTEAPLDA